MLITTIHSIDSIPDLKAAGVDAILIGVQNVSIRSIHEYSLEEVANIKSICDRYNIELYINCLKFFMEEDLELLNQTLQFCKEHHIGVYYADEGVLYAAKQIQYAHALVYQPETLITNHFDLQFYLKEGIQAVSLAHELSLDEIKSIANHTSNIEVLISGYFSILYSRRPLVQNYLDAVHLDNDAHKRYDIVEQTRQERMPIIEDQNGTHIFSEAPIQSVIEYPQLQKMGIERYRIDSIFYDDAWTLDQIHAYASGVVSSGSNHWYHQETIKKKEKDHE